MDDKDDFGLDESFDLEPIKPQEIEVYDAPLESADSYDLEAARQNIHHLLQKGTVALDELISITRQSQSIAGFEQVTKMLKAMSDINRDLIAVQEKKKLLKIGDDYKNENTDGKVINNNLFVATTEDFSRMVEDLEKSKYGNNK